MSVALSIAFTGLCALVADGSGSPAQILLVDAKGIGEVGGMTLPTHAPTLVVSLRDLANADTSGPTRVVTSAAPELDQLGLWDLSASEVWIRVQGGGGPALRLFEPSGDETTWPAAPRNVNDPDAWRDPRFVADMAALSGDGRIDPVFVAPGLPAAVAARIHLDRGLLEGGMPSQELYRDDLFEFKTSGSKGSHRQALTDTIQWTLQTEGTFVVIEIAPVGGGLVKRLLLAPSATAHRISVSNLPLENSAHDEFHAMSDEQLSALHFGVFYKLLLNNPSEWALPAVWTPAIRRNGTGLIRPAFCPPARFTRN
jgi:hypothetical protein